MSSLRTKIIFVALALYHCILSNAKVDPFFKLQITGGQIGNLNSTRTVESPSKSSPSSSRPTRQKKVNLNTKRRPVSRNKSNNSDSDDVEREKKIKQKGPRVSQEKQSLISTSLNAATSALSFAKKLAKGTVKTAFDLCAVKHVTTHEIAGKWRLMQDVQIGDGMVMSCPASIEFCEDGTVRTSFG